MRKGIEDNSRIISSPGRSPGRAIVLPPALLKFYVKVFYVMGKARSDELSCPCDRSCFSYFSTKTYIVTPHYNRLAETVVIRIPHYNHLAETVLIRGLQCMFLWSNK